MSFKRIQSLVMARNNVVRASVIAVWAACGLILPVPLVQAQTQIPLPKVLQKLQERKAQQEEAAKQFHAFYDFQFTDRVKESGITFRSHAVTDAGRTYKQVHYDHGMGMAVADVFGDGLLDIYFVDQLGQCQLWRNLGHGKFTNITESAGVGMEGKVCAGAAFADVDNDGLPDLFVMTVKFGNVLFHNLGNGKFKDVSKEAGLDYVGHSSSAVFFDFDNDGLLDLFLVNIGIYTSGAKNPDGSYWGLIDALYQRHDQLYLSGKSRGLRMATSFKFNITDLSYDSLIAAGEIACDIIVPVMGLWMC